MRAVVPLKTYGLSTIDIWSGRSVVMLDYNKQPVENLWLGRVASNIISHHPATDRREDIPSSESCKCGETRPLYGAVSRTGYRLGLGMNPCPWDKSSEGRQPKGKRGAAATLPVYVTQIPTIPVRPLCTGREQLQDDYPATYLTGPSK
jgi:hypothetical protein